MTGFAHRALQPCDRSGVDMAKTHIHTINIGDSHYDNNSGFPAMRKNPAGTNVQTRKPAAFGVRCPDRLTRGDGSHPGYADYISGPVTNLQPRKQSCQTDWPGGEIAHALTFTLDQSTRAGHRGAPTTRKKPDSHPTQDPAVLQHTNHTGCRAQRRGFRFRADGYDESAIVSPPTGLL